MKRILILMAAATISLQATAQKAWERLNIDSASFVKTYGTEQDYQLQESYRLSATRRDGYPVVLIGQKMYWFNQLSAYMQQNGYSQTDVSKQGEVLRFSYVQNAAIGRKPARFTIGIKMDKDERISQINVSGDADALSRMFLGYWGMSGISYNDLKSKGVVENRFASDVITFNWKGSAPVINIKSGI